MAKAKKDIFKQGVDNYSINLLWLSKQLVEGQKHIYPAKDIDELITKFLEPAVKWSKSNTSKDGAKINIWYDSQMHHKDAVVNTQKVLDQFIKEQNCYNIELKDIRSIKFITDNEFLFTQNIPLYFRIDFLKLLIEEHELVHEHQDASIFADLEVGDLRPATDSTIAGIRLNKSELFAPQYMQAIQECGVLFNKKLGLSQGLEGIGGAPENQFIQIINEKVTVEALQHNINLIASRAQELLNIDKYEKAKSYQKSAMKLMHWISFDGTLKDLPKLYIHLKKGEVIEIDEGYFKTGITNGKLINYDPKKHGYKVLGSFTQMGADYYNVDFSDPNNPKMINDTSKYNEVTIFCARKTHTRDGRSHTDTYILSENGHPDFVAQFIDVNGIHEIELVGSDV